MYKTFFALLSLILFSCTNVSYNQLAGDIDIKVSADLDANITVGDKISGKGSETLILFIFRLPGTRYRAEGSGTTMSSTSPAQLKLPLYSSFLGFMNPFNIVEHAKGEAIHDAITSSNADLILNPKFTITEQDYFFYKSIKCEVTGRKGTIKSIK